MEVLSIYKYARISPFKARDVAREIQGLAVSDALDILNFTPRKAAGFIGKTLRSAVANAENNHMLVAEDLVIKEATVGDGPSFRRFKARARGSGAPIKRRTCHIRIIVSDDIVLETREAAPKKKAAAKKRVVAKKAAPKKDEAANEEKPAKADSETKDSAASGSKVDENLGLVYESAPEQVDDLKQISGVGPELEKKLNSFGIYQFAQVAEWGDKEITNFDDLLSFKGRIERDDWVKQAKEFSNA